MIDLLLFALLVPPLPAGPLYTDLFTDAIVANTDTTTAFAMTFTSAETVLYADGELHINDYRNGKMTGIVLAMDGRVESQGDLTDGEALRLLAGNFMAYYTQQLQAQEEQYKQRQAHYRAISNHYAFVLDPVTSTRADRAPDHQAALTWALQAWEKALGTRLWIQRPALQLGGRGSCNVDNAAWACALVSRGKPLIVFEDLNGLSPGDYRTILMHEIGHLLGVPHIEGDPLMNGSYLKSALNSPSRAAVALARLAIPEQVTRK